MQHLSGLDALFLRLETPRQAMTITGVAVYDPASRAGGPVGLRDVLERARRTADQWAVYRRKLVPSTLGLDQPAWADDLDFNVEDHIFHTSLPAPGTREQLNKEIARLHARVLDRGRPPWEWWFIDGLDAYGEAPPGCFAIAYLHHHAAFDGIAAWNVFRAAHDEASEAPISPEPIVSRSRHLAARGSDRLGSAGRSVARLLEQSERLSDTLRATAPLLGRAARAVWGPRGLSSLKAPHTLFNNPASGSRGHARVQVSVDDLRAIGAAGERATIHDAVLAIVGGALRSYLALHGWRSVHPLIVGTPVAIRGERRRADAANNVVMAIMPLGAHLADPLRRLDFVSEWTRSRKQMISEYPVHRFSDYLDYLNGTAASLLLNLYKGLRVDRVIGPPVNCLVTNVRGSAEVLRFAGVRMIDYEFSAPLFDPINLVHCVSDYAGTVTIAFDFDAEAMRDPEIYCQSLLYSKGELLAAAKARLAPTP
jgi:diacylglycerol O-acyltransferase